jgi:hypothetical protein
VDDPEASRACRRRPLDLDHHHRPRQLRLARPLAADLRLPWERPAQQGRLTPARARRGFRNIHATMPRLAGALKPGKPGPGRPPGSKNRHPAPRHNVGTTTKRDGTLKARRERTG